MGIIVFPSEAVARNWDGALQARLRRAPLERFLRRRGIVPAPPGVSQDSDNLVRATVFLVETGIALYFEDRAEDLALSQRALIGHLACLVNRELAELISQPGAWRIAALVSTARLLSPWIGLGAAALASASAARRFQREWPAVASSIDARIGHTVLAAVAEDTPTAMAEVSASVAARLSCPMAMESERAEA
jgi:hypothetical protein